MHVLSILVNAIKSFLELFFLALERLRPSRRDLPLWLTLCFFVLYALFFNQFFQGSELRLTVLQTDLMAMHLEENPGQEMKEMKFLAKNIMKIREENKGQFKHTLLLDTGSSFFYESYDPKRQRELAQSVSKMTKALDYDAMILSGEDFLFGLDTLKDLLKWTNVSILASGFGEQSIVPFKNYTIKRMGNLNVAIIGLSNLDYLQANAFRGSTNQNILWDQSIEKNFKNALMQAQDDGADIFIAISSLKNSEKEEEILSRFSSSIHLMVSSCELSKQREKCGKISSVKGVPIVRVPHDEFQLGRMDIVLNYDTKKILRYEWKNILIDKKRKELKFEEEKELTSFKRPYDFDYPAEYLADLEDERIKEVMSKESLIVRSLASVKDPDEEESPWGNYICDTLLSKYEKQGIDLVLLGSEEIRSPTQLPSFMTITSSNEMKKIENFSNEIHLSDLIWAIPENSPLFRLNLLGKDIKNIIQLRLQNVFSDSLDEEFDIWQTSGVLMSFDTKGKLKNLILKSRGKEIEDDKIYSLLMTEKGLDFLKSEKVSLSNFSSIPGAFLRSDILGRIKLEKFLWVNSDKRIEIPRERGLAEKKLDSHQGK